MDQVKVYLGVAKKHHFWILIAMVVIIALVVWLKASNSLATKYETDKRTIVGAEESVSKAQGSDTYNPRFTEKVDKLHEGLKTTVFDAWQKLYQQQVALFVWPDFSEYDANVDLNRFRPDEEIPEYIRVIYNEKISRKQWEELLQKVQIRRPKVQTRESDVDVEEAEERRGIEYEGLVVWTPDRREAIISRYYTPNAVPSSKRIRLAQEDYWLFESLIEVVNTVNAGASDTLKAPIKEIQTLDVAQWAIAASLESGASIHVPGKSDTAATSSSGPMGMPTPGMAPPAGATGAMPPTSTGASATAGGATTAAESEKEKDKEWLTDRYLDDKGQSLAADAAQPFAEFKQVFVDMKFVMDQRRIPELVAACANARLPIETRQIRVQILKGDGGLFSGGGPGGMDAGPMGMGSGGMGPMGMGSGGMGPMGMGSGGMGPGGMGPGGMGPMGMGPGGPDAASGFGGLSALQEGGVETTVYDALVELSGVIYLYQPPDVTKLGTGASGAPEKRSFGVPTKAVHPPRSSGTSGGGYMGPSMMGPMTSGSAGR